MHIEFKGGGPLLMLDGVLTEEGLKRQQSGAIEFKVIEPPALRGDSTQLARIDQLTTETQASLDRMRHTPATHPRVRSALKLLGQLAAEGRATRGTANRK